MSEATFTFRADEALKNDFTIAAKAGSRTGVQFLRDFMRESISPSCNTPQAWGFEVMRLYPPGTAKPEDQV